MCLCACCCETRQGFQLILRPVLEWSEQGVHPRDSDVRTVLVCVQPCSQSDPVVHMGINCDLDQVQHLNTGVLK